MSASASMLHLEFMQKGQCVRPQPAQRASFVSSMAELVHDVIPHQQVSGCQKSKEPERVDWISFQFTDLNDPRWQSQLVDVIGSSPPIITVIGLARGYQIWALLSNGDCEELLSDRQGPVRTAVILPSPEPCFGVEKDDFAQSRPLVAIVNGVCAVPERQFCTVSIISLATGNQVHSLRFEEPVCSLRVTSRYCLVLFPDKLIVYDTSRFCQRLTIRDCVKIDDPCSGSPVALGVLWLAYADTKLNHITLSGGGVVADDSLPSYTSQVISAAKNIGKSVSALSESVVSTLSSSPHSKFHPMNEHNPGLVTIVNLEPFDQSNDSSNHNNVVAHFPAHLDEPVGFLHFAHGGCLLLSSGQSSHCFHVFSILPHPISSALAAVHHLYILFRGSTPAKVLSCAFSDDNRWLSLATNHGTTHVFPITPYGGTITMRTHGGKFVNRESRFRRTAGLDGIVDPNGSESPPRNNKVVNPRLPPYPHPIVVQAVAKIRQRFLSSDNLAAWASDVVAPVSLPSSKKTTSCTPSSKKSIAEYHRVAVVFATERSWTGGRNEYSRRNALFVGSHDGVLTEYRLKIHPSAVPSGGKVFWDSPIELEVVPIAQWNLTSPDLRAPLNDSNLLMTSACLKPYSETKSEDNTWISQVEMTTYGGPHRRLWMGPQFTFRTFDFDQSQHQSADLISPTDGKRSAPMPTPICTHSVPVVIEASSLAVSMCENQSSRHVCGSWSDNDYISCSDGHEGRLRETIADAMQETRLTDGDFDDMGPMEDARSDFSESPSRDGLHFSGMDV